MCTAGLVWLLYVCTVDTCLACAPLRSRLMLCVYVCVCAPTCVAGLFMAPQTTGEALKGGRLVAEVLHREGYHVIPGPGATDQIRAFSDLTLYHPSGLCFFFVPEWSLTSCPSR